MEDNKDDLQREISNDPETGETAEQTYLKLLRLMDITKLMKISQDKKDAYKQIAKQFTALNGYKDSEQYAENCIQLAKQAKKELKKKIYEDAINKKNNAKQAQDYCLAAQEFRKISGYQDADALAEECDSLGEKLEKKDTRKRLITFAFIVMGVICIFIGANTAHAKYYLANAYQFTHTYDSAIKMYRKLGAYKDSKERLKQCRYNYAVDLMKDGDYKGAEELFSDADGYKDSRTQKAAMEKLQLKNGQPGDLITIGKYEWEILDKNNNQVCLMIKTALPGMAYNNELSEVTWETSTLRQWLNSEFLSSSFSDVERNNIVLTEVKNNNNTKYETLGGNNTKDYLFLLSSEEAVLYNELFPNFKSNCWLRTPGNDRSSAAFLSVDKVVMDYGYAVNSADINVRPVMWFKLD